MARSLKEIEQGVMQLSAGDRSLLVEHLIENLDLSSDGDVEELWVREAEQRYQAYRQGRLAGKAASAVFKDAASKLK